MKKTVLSLLALCALVMMSCSEDNDDNINPNAPIDGTWKLTAWNVENGLDFNQDGTASNNILDEVDCLNNELLVFGANNIATFNSSSYLDIEIELITGTTDEYVWDIDCGEDTDIQNS